MDNEIIQLNTIHSDIGKKIFEVESLTLNKGLKDKIKTSLFDAVDIITEAIECLECANTFSDNEGIEVN